MKQIREVSPAADSVAATLFDAPDYQDAFEVVGAVFDTVADFATAYFLNQPRWLSLVSMNLSSPEKLRHAIGDGAYEQGSAVGSWKVYERTADEIVFGDDMGFMEYRFSMLRRPTGEIEASTVVKYQWRRMSHVYFSLVKPVHRRFVPISLRAALQADAAGSVPA